MKRKTFAALTTTLLLVVTSVRALEPAVAPAPLQKGFYLAPLLNFTLADSKHDTSDGFGGALNGGYRYNSLALELSGHYTKLSSSSLRGVGANALVFPLSVLPNAYVIAGAGYFEARKNPGPNPSFDGQYLQAGLGSLFPLAIGDYEFGIRGEALLRFSEVHNLPLNSGEPKSYDDVLFNLGLQLPFGAKAEPPPPAPVAVVPVVVDSDGDGVFDDKDQCPDTPQGTTVDALGCPLPPPPAPVKLICNDPTARNGKVLSLSGCGSGDKIVLQGVNFDFDQSTLTSNGKSILDDVAGEMSAWQLVLIELGGHTDSRGKDDYNQRLSQARVKSVQVYLVSKGITEDRMSAKGFGEAVPIASNDTDEGRALNRRVEVTILGAGDGTAAEPAAAAAPAAAELAPAEAAPATAPQPTTDPASAETMTEAAPETAPTEAAPAAAEPAPASETVPADEAAPATH